MRIFPVIWLTFGVGFAADTLVLRNITVVDGTGRPPFSATVVVQGERITQVEANAPK